MVGYSKTVIALAVCLARSVITAACLSSQLAKNVDHFTKINNRLKNKTS